MNEIAKKQLRKAEELRQHAVDERLKYVELEQQLDEMKLEIPKLKAELKEMEANLYKPTEESVRELEEKLKEVNEGLSSSSDRTLKITDIWFLPSNKFANTHNYIQTELINSHISGNMAKAGVSYLPTNPLDEKTFIEAKNKLETATIENKPILTRYIRLYKAWKIWREDFGSYMKRVRDVIDERKLNIQRHIGAINELTRQTTTIHANPPPTLYAKVQKQKHIAEEAYKEAMHATEQSRLISPEAFKIDENAVELVKKIRQQQKTLEDMLELLLTRTNIQQHGVV